MTVALLSRLVSLILCGFFCYLISLTDGLWQLAAVANVDEKTLG